MVNNYNHKKLARGILGMFLSFLLAAMPAGTLKAQTDEPAYLVVSLADGTVNEYILAEKPVVTFLGDKMKFSSDQIEQEYPAEDVKGFHFSSVSTGIGRTNGGNMVSINFTDNNCVAITGLSKGHVRLYNASGQLLRTVSVKGQSASISLQGLAPGSYIVAPEGVPAMKISKK